MKWTCVVLAAVVAMAGVSCTQNAATPAGGAKAAPVAEKPAAVGVGGAAAPAAPVSGMNIPKDARWTIFCGMYGEADHIQRTKFIRDNLIKSTGLRDWYVVHGEGQSTLYYGFYREIDERADKAEAGRAQGDRRSISAMRDPSNGGSLFRSVVIMPLDEADPAAPGEWNLLNAKNKGFYTLQIAVYKENSQRKEAAVQSVREARAAGYEAYYYHGPTTSSVCIGVWPESAVKEIGETRAKNPNEVLMLVPGYVPVPQGQLMTPDGKPIAIVQAKVEIVDQSLLATMRTFPRHSINGVESWEVTDPKTGRKRETTHPSVLVKIPQDQAVRPAAVRPAAVRPAAVRPAAVEANRPDPNAGMIRRDPTPVPTADVVPAAVSEQPRPAGRLPASKQGGRLKSLEDK